LILIKYLGFAATKAAQQRRTPKRYRDTKANLSLALWSASAFQRFGIV
jgi:hypothetical protein